MHKISFNTLPIETHRTWPSSNAATAKSLTCATSCIRATGKLEMVTVKPTGAELRDQTVSTRRLTGHAESEDGEASRSPFGAKSDSGSDAKQELEIQVAVLQEYIYELLIKNQRLRWQLQSGQIDPCE